MSNTRRLNLGSGLFKKDGFINLDVLPETDPDVVHDLDVFPYPFPDNEFDLVEADHVLEHLNHPLKALCEIHRIAKPGALVVVRVPHASRGFTNPDHKRGFDVTLPFYFKHSFKGGYQGVEFELKRMRFSWFAQHYLKKQTISKPLYISAYCAGSIISFFANLAPLFCARVWCYMVGGFEEIEFQFIVSKNSSSPRHPAERQYAAPTTSA